MKAAGLRPPHLRAIVLDIDGTLTDGHRRLHRPAVAYLDRFRRRGVPIVLATGNVLPVALALRRFLDLGTALIAENGGILYEERDGKEVVTRLARRSLALRALTALHQAGVPAEPLFTDRWRETEVALRFDTPVDRARLILAQHPIEVVPTGFAVHLIERGKGKLPALRRLLRPMGLSPSDCLIAGDGENDAPMLGAAGWAVSFRGADITTRAAADFVSRAANGAGLVEALKRVEAMAPIGR